MIFGRPIMELKHLPTYHSPLSYAYHCTADIEAMIQHRYTRYRMSIVIHYATEEPLRRNIKENVSRLVEHQLYDM